MRFSLDHTVELAVAAIAAGIVLAWMNSPAKAEPAPNPAPGPSVPPFGTPKPIPIPTPQEPLPDLVAGHWYLVTVQTSVPITDDWVAERMKTVGTGSSPILGADVGKWWRINDRTYAFTVRPKVTVPASALPVRDNIQIREVNAWDDGPS